MKLFVGLDVSSFDIKVCFLDGEGEKIKSFTTANDLPGATDLRDSILHTVKNQSIEVLRFGIESKTKFTCRKERK